MSHQCNEQQVSSMAILWLGDLPNFVLLGKLAELAFDARERNALDECFLQEEEQQDYG
jgi:hypothetical protein